MELYISRHGETISNFEKRMLGSGGDSPLTEKGIEQARALGKSLANITFDAVYVSPLKRAIDTAKIAFDYKYEIMTDKRLTEIGLGDIEGMTWDEAAIAFPETSTFMSDPLAYIPPPNGEKLDDMIKRIDSFLEDIIKLNYSKVFIMTHGYVMRILYACTTDKSIAAIGKSPNCGNCEIIRYIYSFGKWQ
jgi:probable phosphoglycerate mutase